MAASVSREFEVLQTYFHRLNNAIGETGPSIAIVCFGSKLISRQTMEKGTKNSSTVNTRNYHLLKDILIAVAGHQENFMKFLSVLESFPPLDNIAREMKQDLKSLHNLVVPATSHRKPQLSRIVDDDDDDDECQTRNKLDQLVYDVNKFVELAKVNVDDLKECIILKNVFNRQVAINIESANKSKEIFRVICFNLSSPINLHTLLDIADRFILPDVIAAVQSYELEQNKFHLKLTNEQFTKELQKELTSCNQAVIMEIKIIEPHTPTISEFEKMLNEIFLDLAHYVRPLKVEVKDVVVVVTLFAPKPVMEGLIVTARRKLPHINDVIHSLIIGGEIIVKENELTKEPVSHESLLQPALGVVYICGITTNLILDKDELEINEQEHMDKDLVQENEVDNAEPLDEEVNEESEWEEVQDQNGDNDSVISTKMTNLDIEMPISSDGRTSLSHELTHSDLHGAATISRMTEDNGNNEQDKLIKASMLWRHNSLKPRDVVIIGSFGYVTNKQVQVCPKIVPKELRESSKWINDEVDNIIELCNSNPSNYCLKHVYRDYPGAERSKSFYLRIIKTLFENCQNPGVIIRYTGHGEKDTGNWCFQDGVITFDEVFHLYMKYFKGKGLTIISDCSYSGNWIKLSVKKLDALGIPSCGHHTRQEGILLKVFASCEVNRKATALTYINEGAIYNPADDKVVHNPKKMSSGQKSQIASFTNIYCSKRPNEICEVHTKCSWEDRIYPKADRVLMVRGRIKKSPVWHCVLVDQDKIETFKNKVATGTVDVAHYGEMLYSGWGDHPPKDIIRQIKMRFTKYIESDKE